MADEFDMTETEFDARMEGAEPARLVSKDDRVTLSPLEFTDAIRALLRSPRPEESRFSGNTFRGQALSTETLAKSIRH